MANEIAGMLDTVSRYFTLLDRNGEWRFKCVENRGH